MTRGPATVVKGLSARDGLAGPLFHFTCDHGAAGIVATGTLMPWPHPLMVQAGGFVWLTSEAEPERHDVGLTSTTLACDRMAHRFRVIEPDTCLWWPEVRDLLAAYCLLSRDSAYMLEHGRRPDTWWVSPVAVPVVLA